MSTTKTKNGRNRQRTLSVGAGLRRSLLPDLVGMNVTEALDRVEQLRIARIRAEIAAGTYLTNDKLDFVAGCLADALTGPRRLPRAV